MMKERDVEEILGGDCRPRFSRKRIKYITIDKNEAYGAISNCKTYCQFYPCEPKPYLVVPITKELKAALRMYFIRLSYNANEYERSMRRKEIKKFVREWVKKK